MTKAHKPLSAGAFVTFPGGKVILIVLDLKLMDEVTPWIRDHKIQSARISNNRRHLLT
jgi:hypothetical protein